MNKKNQAKRNKNCCQHNLLWTIRASGLNQWRVYFYEVRKIFRILLRTRKNKSKQKEFAMCVAESKRWCSRTVHSSTIGNNFEKN